MESRLRRVDTGKRWGEFLEKNGSFTAGEITANPAVS
jgi:hypothetical protein